MKSIDVDCLIIGGGPAGLTAATYLGRFRRSALLLDAGNSRASLIPTTHNVTGFIDGIGGPDLLERMRQQAEKYGARMERGAVRALHRRSGGRFLAHTQDHAINSTLVLLATGGSDVEPQLADIGEAVRSGLIRYCPVCDAFEAKGQRVALIAYGKCRIKEALLLRGYTSDLTILTLGQEMHLSSEEESILTEARISLLRDPIAKLSREAGRLMAWTEHDHQPHYFDTMYSALGTRFHSDLATELGAKANEDGALIVDRHQQTTIEGLYAAGDVVRGLSQISIAAAHAAIAATAMNASLPPLRY